MKIKIITCHDVYNHGASLQTLAMQTYLRELGHDVAVIDYKPPYLSGHYSFTKVDNPVYDHFLIRYLYLLAKIPGRIRRLPRKKAFDRFTSSYLNLTERYKSAESLKSNPPEADLYIAGSDQIWNTLFPNGHDPAFYLDFVRSGRKASFAASFATDRIYGVDPATIAKRLRSFDAISVRERSGLGILDTLGITEATVTADPAFLLTAEQWSRLAIKPSSPTLPDKYILFYSFDNSPLSYMLCIYLHERFGLPVVSVSPTRPAIDAIDCSSVGPLEFVSLIENADMVVTDSYHGIIFSVIFEKPFYSVDRRENINIRTADLLSSLNLSERKVSRLDSVPFHRIDYDEARHALRAMVYTSRNFISEITRPM